VESGIEAGLARKPQRCLVQRLHKSFWREFVVSDRAGSGRRGPWPLIRSHGELGRIVCTMEASGWLLCLLHFSGDIGASGMATRQWDGGGLWAGADTRFLNAYYDTCFLSFSAPAGAVLTPALGRTEEEDLVKVEAEEVVMDKE